MSEALLGAGALALLGALVGSFLATVAIRWPQERSALAGRSACDGCGRTLRAHELVPLASAFLQRGRCRACGARLDPRPWQNELAAAAPGASPRPCAPGRIVAMWSLFRLPLPPCPLIPALVSSPSNKPYSSPAPAGRWTLALMEDSGWWAASQRPAFAPGWPPALPAPPPAHASGRLAPAQPAGLGPTSGPGTSGV